MASAGLSNVAVVGNAPTGDALRQIRDGEMVGGTAYDFVYYQWVMHDMLARLMTGQPLDRTRSLTSSRRISLQGTVTDELVNSGAWAPFPMGEFEQLWAMLKQMPPMRGRPRLLPRAPSVIRRSAARGEREQAPDELRLGVRQCIEFVEVIETVAHPVLSRQPRGLPGGEVVGGLPEEFARLERPECQTGWCRHREVEDRAVAQDLLRCELKVRLHLRVRERSQVEELRSTATPPEMIEFGRPYSPSQSVSRSRATRCPPAGVADDDDPARIGTVLLAIAICPGDARPHLADDLVDRDGGGTACRSGSSQSRLDRLARVRGSCARCSSIDQ